VTTAASRRSNDLKDPDAPITSRTSSSSMDVLVARFGSCLDAYRAVDEPALRVELGYLEAEVRTLKAQRVIIPSKAGRRMTIAAEREPMGRIG
jgi:hypothetical protein